MKKKHLISFIVEVIVLLIGISAILIGAYAEDRNMTLNYLFNQTERISDAASVRVNRFFRDNVDEVETLAFLFGQDLKDNQSSVKLLIGLEEAGGNSVFRFVNKDGISYSLEGDTLDVRERDYYRKGITGEKGTAVIYESMRDGEEYIVYYAPVYVDGEIFGVLAELAPIETLYDVLSEETNGNPTTSIIVDEKGKTIVGNITNRDYDYSSVSDLIKLVDEENKNEIINAINNRTKVSVYYKGIMGSNIGYIVPVEETDWFLLQMFPMDTIYRQISNDNKQPVIVFGGVGILFTLFIICFVVTIVRETTKSHSDEMQKQMNTILRSVSGDYVYLVDVNMNSLEEIRYKLQNEQGINEWKRDKVLFPESIKRYAEINVSEYDRARFLKETSFEFLVEKLRETSEYYIEYDSVLKGKTKRLQGKFIIDNTKRDEPHLLVSIRDITAITNERYEVQLEKKLIVAAACSVYPFILEENITENTYRIMYSLGDIKPSVTSSGALDDLLRYVVKSIPDAEERNRISEIFDRNIILDKFKRGEKKIEIRYRQIAEDGNLHWMETKLILMEGENDNVSGVSLSRMIDDEIQREIDLSEARNKAEQADKNKTRYLYGIAHDIRTPLNVLMGYTTLAYKNMDDKLALEEYLTKAKYSQNNLIKMIDGLLDMVSMENEELVVDERPTDATWSVDKILALVGPEGREKGITFKTNSDFYNPYFYQDMLKNAKVVYNILSLAIKNSETHGIIYFSLTQIPGQYQDDCIIEFECTYKGKMIYKNEGNSIPEEIEIANKFLKIMGGTSYVSEEDGNVTITTRTPHKIAIKESTEENVDISILQSTINGKRILVADTDSSIREITETILKESGMIVETCDSEQELIKRINNKDINEIYDLLLIDEKLNKKDVYEIAGSVRKLEDKDRKNIPILMFANGITKEVVRKAKEAGINDYISKPVVTEDLLKSIARIIKVNK